MLNLFHNLFGNETAHQKAIKELAEAEIQLLSYQSSFEYSASMVNFYENKVARLSAILRKREGSEL